MDYTHYEIQPRQRLTTDALNEQEDWLGRMTIEVARRLVGGDSFTLSGVIDGLLVTPVPGTMNSLVNGGLALLYDATVVSPGNTHRWIEVPDGTPISVTHDNGDASPRWDVIEIAPGVVDGTPDILDVYDPALGAPVPVLLAPLKICTPTVTIRKGTPAAFPKIPAGAASLIPLAVVYVAAGAIELDATKIIYCRPILRPRIGNNSPSLASGPVTHVRGGGWNIETNGTSGTCPNGMSGFFRGSSTPFQIAAGTVIALEATSNYDGGGVPVADTLVHMYAAPPPYPAGYDSNLAGRELFCTDAALLWGGYKAGMSGCIVVGSPDAPTLDVNGNPSGAVSLVAHNLWGSIAMTTNQMLYLGSAFWDQGIPGLVAQRVHGPWVAPGRKTGFDFTSALPIVGPTVFNLRAKIAGDDDMVLPITARHFQIAGEFNLLTTGTIFMTMQDDWTGTGSHGELVISMTNVAAGTKNIGGAYEIYATSNGDIAIEAAVVTNIAAGGVQFYVRAYADEILQMR